MQVYTVSKFKKKLLHKLLKKLMSSDNIWFNYSISFCLIKQSVAWALHKSPEILILAERIIKDVNMQLNVCV